jgi:hypothetical protein
MELGIARGSVCLTVYYYYYYYYYYTDLWFFSYLIWCLGDNDCKAHFGWMTIQGQGKFLVHLEFLSFFSLLFFSFFGVRHSHVQACPRRTTRPASVSSRTRPQTRSGRSTTWAS